MAMTGERIRRACGAPLPIDLYDRDDSASMVRCSRPQRHDGEHEATITTPRTVRWVDRSVDSSIPRGRSQSIHGVPS